MIQKLYTDYDNVLYVASVQNIVQFEQQIKLILCMLFFDPDLLVYNDN